MFMPGACGQRIGSGAFLRPDALQGGLDRVCRALCGFGRTRQALRLTARDVALQAGVSLLVALARLIAALAAGLQLFGGVSQAADDRYHPCWQWLHLDAIDRAGRQAQVTAGAFAGNDRVHQLGGADDGIDRAGLDALGATDAFGFANTGDLGRCAAAQRVRRKQWLLEQRCQRSDGFAATWRALVDGPARCQFFGVGPTAIVAAFATLGLWQQGIDALNQIH